MALTLFRHDLKQAAARERCVTNATLIPAFRGQAGEYPDFSLMSLKGCVQPVETTRQISLEVFQSI